jgi:ABC-2 type transport system permease protein
MIMVMPTVQLIVLPLAADYEVKNINIAVVDHDHSDYADEMIESITSSGYFKLTGYESSFTDAFRLLEADKADLILEIPDKFERNLLRESHGTVFIAVNAINGVKANLGGAYLNSIIGQFNHRLRLNLVAQETTSDTIELRSANWFNPLLNYRFFMVPGILAILVTMIGGFLSALNIVKEKEAGTIEQVNVTPIRKYQFILGKLIPFWVLGNIVFTIGLVVSWALYGIVPEGNLLALYAFIGVYLLCVLGFGLLVSTFCETQQQAMFIMFFFMMIFILMGGLFTSVDSMPDWAQLVSKLNPVAYLIKVMRMIILKGSTLRDVAADLGIVATLAVVLNAMAIFNYRKTS